jgi:hypothetical protein
MKTTTLWIIRLALTVQFIGVLAVPSLLAAAEAPRAMWMAEWLRRPQSIGLSSVAQGAKGERTIGVLELRNGRLAFTEQVGLVDWAVDLADVKSATIVSNGHALLIASFNGDSFVTTILEPNLTPQSPKRALSTIERAMQRLSTNAR